MSLLARAGRPMQHLLAALRQQYCYEILSTSPDWGLPTSWHANAIYMSSAISVPWGCAISPVPFVSQHFEASFTGHLLHAWQMHCCSVSSFLWSGDVLECLTKCSVMTAVGMRCRLYGKANAVCKPILLQRAPAAQRQ